MPDTEPDYLDRAVAYFAERPLEIQEAWYTPNEHPFGYLFGYLGPDRRNCGYDCPVQARQARAIPARRSARRR